jgi:predicted outer membrane repeat protein
MFPASLPGVLVARVVGLFAPCLCILMAPAAIVWGEPAAEPPPVVYVDDDADLDPGPGDPTISDPAENGMAEHPFDTFQEALDVVAVGGEVIVRDGLYTGCGNKQIWFYGKAVYLHSEHGPEHCIIDLQGFGTGFCIYRGETAATRLEGLTIRNGTQGIGCSHSSPTICHCIISGNLGGYASYGGGGISSYCGGPTITDCVFDGNRASNGQGGAINLIDFDANSATIANCVITNNTAVEEGGGIYAESDGDVAIRDCLVVGNVGVKRGGGICCVPSPWRSGGLTIKGCTVVNNTVLPMAGYPYGRGGGVAICCMPLEPRAVENCILWGNTAATGDPQIQAEIATPVEQRIAYCDIQSDQPLGPQFYQIISADPLFVNPAGGDFHLGEGSPCINAGDPDFVPVTGETDLDGQQRMYGGRVEIGVDERYPFVDCNANGVPDSEDIASGASADCNGNEVPDECEGEDCNDNGVLDECDLAAGTSLDCNSNGIPDECERDCNGNGVADDCDLANGTSIDENGNGVPDECDYVPRVLYVDDDAPGDPGPGDPTVSDPYEDGSAAHPFDAIQKAIDASYSGDEIVVQDGSYTGPGNKEIRFFGRGVYLHSTGGPQACVLDAQGQSTPILCQDYETRETRIEGFTIQNGYNDYDAGGIGCYDSSPTIRNCLIRNNTAVYFGTVWLDHSNAVLSNCRILDNDGAISGCGAIRCDGGSPVIRDCVLAGNTATWGAGIDFYGATDAVVTNCTVVNNTSEWRSGGVTCWSSSPVVRNCILWGNHAPSHLEVYLEGSAHPVLDYCDLDVELPAGVVDGGHNLYVDPMLVDEVTGHLAYGSPAVDAGDPAFVPAPGETDIDGRPRVSGWRVDLGADEYDSSDCNNNGVLDSEDIAGGISADCDANGVPDECQLGGLMDCNLNGVIDLCDVDVGTSQDCNIDGIPDECEAGGDQDCDGDGLSDLCALVSGSPDLNANGVPDECEPQVELFVDDDGPHDPGPGDPTISDPLEDGTLVHPFDAIQEALNAAPAGTSEVVTIWVADGLYTGIGNRDLDFGGKVLTLRSVHGPESCIIDAQQLGRGFYFHTHETPATVLDGFTIRNGTATVYAGGVVCSPASPTIRNCIITGNNFGGVEYVDTSGNALRLQNCQITGNTAPHGGAGVYCGTECLMLNCVITGNQSTDWYCEGGGVFGGNWSIITIRDSVIAGNVCADEYGGDDARAGAVFSEGDMLTIDHCTITQNDVGTGSASAIATWECCTVIRNSIIWGNLPASSQFAFGVPAVMAYSDIGGGLPPGTLDWGGNIDADPLLVGPAFGNFHLQPGSPCIDQGDPDFAPAAGETDIDGQPRVRYGRVDMGADEFCCRHVCGDLDCDGDVDFGDINPFVQFLANFSLWQTTHPGCPPQNGDTNGDGLYPDFGDINPFVALLTGS